MKHVRKRLTYANVMSTIAVFLVLGGATAFAASQLGKESVGTRQLKKEAVSLAKINKAAKNALKGQAGATGPDGKQGARGAQGSIGPKGEKGDTGPSTGPAGGVLTGTYPNPGLADSAVTNTKIAAGAITGSKVVTNIQEGFVEVATESSSQVVVGCAAGEKIISIGYFWGVSNKLLTIQNSFYLLNAGIVRGYNGTNATQKLNIQVLCLGA